MSFRLVKSGMLPVFNHKTHNENQNWGSNLEIKEILTNAWTNFAFNLIGTSCQLEVETAERYAHEGLIARISCWQPSVKLRVLLQPSFDDYGLIHSLSHSGKIYPYCSVSQLTGGNYLSLSSFLSLIKINRCYGIVHCPSMMCRYPLLLSPLVHRVASFDLYRFYNTFVCLNSQLLRFKLTAYITA